MTLGEKLKQAREEAGLKQREVASILNIDQAKVIRIEKGIIKVDAEIILPKLAKLYKKPISWFYEEEDMEEKIREQVVKICIAYGSCFKCSYYKMGNCLYEKKIRERTARYRRYKCKE